jgi:hypothetical protein
MAPTPITARDVCEDALFELNILAAGEVMGADDATFVLRQLNTLLDELNAERAAVWADVYLTFQVPAPVTPYVAPTIGPTGTFVVAQRPESLEGAGVLTGGAGMGSGTAGPSSTFAPIRLRDKAWYQAQALPFETATWPTDLYYNPLWPNGDLHFWPVPAAAVWFYLATRLVLTGLALTDTFSLPPGYQSMLQKTLAERIAAPYEKPVPGQLARDAATARARVFRANAQIPRLTTRDRGLPGGGGATGDWRTGYV